MKISITCITPVLQAILDFFPDIISFQHVFHLGVGRSQIEWKLKAKTQISVFPWAKIGQNDHSNPYIESTTVLSDSLYIIYSSLTCISLLLDTYNTESLYYYLMTYFPDTRCFCLSWTRKVIPCSRLAISS